MSNRKVEVSKRDISTLADISKIPGIPEISNLQATEYKFAELHSLAKEKQGMLSRQSHEVMWSETKTSAAMIGKVIPMTIVKWESRDVSIGELFRLTPSTIFARALAVSGYFPRAQFEIHELISKRGRRVFDPILYVVLDPMRKKRRRKPIGIWKDDVVIR